MILIDCYENRAVRCAGDGKPELIEAIYAQITKGNPIYWEGDEMVADEVADLVNGCDSDVLGEAFDGFILTEEEGSEGVAVGFSTADRMAFPYKWPASDADGDFFGNNDPMVYKTNGQPVGVPVTGTEEPHP